MGKKKKSRKTNAVIETTIPETVEPKTNLVDDFFSSPGEITEYNEDDNLDFEAIFDEEEEEVPDYSKVKYAFPELTEQQKELARRYGFEYLLDVLPKEREKTPSESQVYLGKEKPKPGVTSVSEGVFHPETMPMINDFKEDIPKVEMTKHAQDLLRESTRADHTYIASDSFNIDGKTLLRSPKQFAEKVLQVQNDESIIPAPDKEIKLLFEFVKYEDYDESLSPEQIKALFYLPKHNRRDILDRVSNTEDLVKESPSGEDTKRGRTFEEMRDTLNEVYSRNMHSITNSLQVLLPYFKRSLKKNDMTEDELEALKVMYENVGLMEEFDVSKQYESRGFLTDVYYEAMEEIYDLLSNINYDFDPEAQVAYAVVERFKDSVAKDNKLNFKGLYKLLVDLWFKGFIDMHMPEQFNASILLEQAMEYFEANPIYEEEWRGKKYVINMLDRIKAKRGETTSPAVPLEEYENNYTKKLEEENMPLNVPDNFIANAANMSTSNAQDTPADFFNFKNWDPDVPGYLQGVKKKEEEPHVPTNMTIHKPEPMDNHKATRLNFEQPVKPETKEFQRPMHGGIGKTFPNTERLVQVNGSPDLTGLPQLSGYERTYNIPYEGVIISCDDGRFYLIEPQVVAEINTLRKYTQEEHNKTIKASFPEDAFIRPTTLIHDKYWKTPTITGYVPYHCYLEKSPIVKELVWLSQEDYYTMCKSALAADQAAGYDPKHFSETTGSNLHYANAYNEAYTILKGSVRSDYADKRINTPILPTPVREPRFIETGVQANYGDLMNLTHGYGIGEYTEINNDGWCGIGCGYTPIGNNMTFAGLNTLLGGNNMRLVNSAAIGTPIASVAPTVTGANNNTSIFGAPIPNPQVNGAIYNKVDTSVVWDKSTNTMVPNPQYNNTAANNTMYIGNNNNPNMGMGVNNMTNMGVQPTATPTFGFMNQTRPGSVLPQQPTVLGFTNMNQVLQNQNQGLNVAGMPQQNTAMPNAFAQPNVNANNDYVAGYNKAKAELEPVIQQMQAQLQAMANEINKLRVNAQGVYQPVTQFQHTQGLGTIGGATNTMTFGSNFATPGYNVNTTGFNNNYYNAFSQPTFGAATTPNFGYTPQPTTATFGGGTFGFTNQAPMTNNYTPMSNGMNNPMFASSFNQPQYAQATPMYNTNFGFNTPQPMNNTVMPQTNFYTPAATMPQNSWTSPTGHTIVQTNVSPMSFPQTQPWTAGTQAPATPVMGMGNNAMFASNFQKPIGSQVTATPYMGASAQPQVMNAQMPVAGYGTSPINFMSNNAATNNFFTPAQAIPAAQAMGYNNYQRPVVI